MDETLKDYKNKVDALWAKIMAVRNLSPNAVLIGIRDLPHIGGKLDRGMVINAIHQLAKEYCGDIEDTDVDNFNYAKEVFKAEEGREPDMNDAKDMNAVAMLEVGIRYARRKEKLNNNINLLAKFFSKERIDGDKDLDRLLGLDDEWNRIYQEHRVKGFSEAAILANELIVNLVNKTNQ